MSQTCCGCGKEIGFCSCVKLPLADIARLLEALDVVNENMTVETPEVVRRAVADALEGRDG